MHFHQVHEFIIFDQIDGDYFCANGRSLLLDNDVVFTPALETHDFELLDKPKTWHIIQFLPSFLVEQGLEYEESMLRKGVHLRLEPQQWQIIRQQVDWLLTSYQQDPHSNQSHTLLKLLIIWIVAHATQVSDSVADTNVNSKNYQRLLPVMDLFKQPQHVTLSLVDAAELCGLSSAYFSRIFKQTFRCNYSQYLVQHKLHIGARMLSQTTNSITEISYDLDFSNPSHFIAQFKKQFSITPKKYRMQIHQA